MKLDSNLVSQKLSSSENIGALAKLKIRCFFQPKITNIFLIYLQKGMLWVLIIRSSKDGSFYVPLSV